MAPLFSTSALDGGEWSFHSLVASPPGKRPPGTHCVVRSALEMYSLHPGLQGLPYPPLLSTLLLHTDVHN
jgi:hypothetical protein